MLSVRIALTWVEIILIIFVSQIEFHSWGAEYAFLFDLTRNIKFNKKFVEKYNKVASTNASRFVTRLVYMHTQNDNSLIRSPSWI